MFCMIKKQLIKTIMNKTIIYLHVTFLSSSESSVVFNISFTHANTNLPNRRFSNDKFLRSRY